MRKLIGIIAICFLFTNCATLFKVETISSTDIQGTTTRQEMKIIYDLIGTVNIYTFSFGKLPDNLFVIIADHTDVNWCFYETIFLKVDDKLFRLDTSPSRNTIYGGVRELLISPLSNEIIDALKVCNSIQIQLDGTKVKSKIYNVQSSGIQNINNFFK